MSEAETTKSIAELLREGLDLYGVNRVDEAIRCWRAVLELAPGHPEALDYLRTAGAAEVIPFRPPKRPATRSETVELNLNAGKVESNPAAPDDSQRISLTPSEVMPSAMTSKLIDRAALVDMVKRKEYEAVLAHLYAARAQAPEDTSLSRSIQVVKNHLAQRYSDQLGDLDRIPRVAPDGGGRTKDYPPEARRVLRLVDGIASIADVIASTRQGRLEATRWLVRFVNDEIIAFGDGEAESYPGGDTTSRERPIPPPARLPSLTTPTRARIAPTPPPVGRARVTPPPTRVAPAHIDPTRPSGSRPRAPARSAPARSAPARSASTPRASTPSARRRVTQTTPPPASSATSDEFDELFEQATCAYVRRDYRSALELFERCLTLRPNDGRTKHNLSRLQGRLNE